MGIEDDQRTREGAEALSTVDLTLQAAAGVDAAFHGLYARHYQRVLRSTALRVGRMLDNSRHEIEEAVQDAFADTLMRIRDGLIPDIHTAYAFRRYIATAAANRVRSMKRKKDAKVRGGDQRRVDHESLFGLLGTSDPGPVTLQALKELEHKLEAAVLALPDHYRQVIQMHCIEGMPYQDIADSRELRSGRGETVDRADQVRLMLHRARKKLEEAIAEA